MVDFILWVNLDYGWFWNIGNFHLWVNMELWVNYTNIGGPRYISHVAACFRLESPLDSQDEQPQNRKTQKGEWWSRTILWILPMAKRWLFPPTPAPGLAPSPTNSPLLCTCFISYSCNEPLSTYFLNKKNNGVVEFENLIILTSNTLNTSAR